MVSPFPAFLLRRSGKLENARARMKREMSGDRKKEVDFVPRGAYLLSLGVRATDVELRA
jgi:hypothetical protein